MATVLGVLGLGVGADVLLGTLLAPTVSQELHPFHHHGLRPSARVTCRWGEGSFTVTTSSLGLRDARIRRVPPRAPGRRFLFMGDSFVMGVGVEEEESFVGRVARALEPVGVEVLNGGVTSYSPHLYLLRTRFLLEQEQLEVDELHVFIDISDPQDEISYASYQPREHPPAWWLSGLRWARSHSLAWRQVQIWRERRAWPPGGTTREIHLAERGRWTLDPGAQERWALRGLGLCEAYMTQLVELCRERGVRLTIAVYPWPEQIRARDLDSLQVRTWRAWAARHSVPFLDLFGPFLQTPDVEATVSRLYLGGDSHWSPAGHEVVARIWLDWYRSGYEVDPPRPLSPR